MCRVSTSCPNVYLSVSYEYLFMGTRRLLGVRVTSTKEHGCIIINCWYSHWEFAPVFQKLHSYWDHLNMHSNLSMLAYQMYIWMSQRCVHPLRPHMHRSVDISICKEYVCSQLYTYCLTVINESCCNIRRHPHWRMLFISNFYHHCRSMMRVRHALDDCNISHIPGKNNTLPSVLGPVLSWMEATRSLTT